MNGRYSGKGAWRLFVLTVLAATASLFCGGALAAGWNFVVPAAEVQPGSNQFVFPLSIFADGKAKYYVYKHSSTERIRFFIVKSSDGVVRCAFDACDVCYRAKKGYVQEGDNMICVNCGLRFATSKINEVKGGCNPAPLARTVQGDKLVIKLQDVVSGLRYFPVGG